MEKFCEVVWFYEKKKQTTKQNKKNCINNSSDDFCMIGRDRPVFNKTE